MRELVDKICKEIDTMKNTNLSPNSVKYLKDLSGAGKNLLTMMAMKDEGYSNGYNHASYSMDRRGRNGDGSYDASYDYSNRMRMDGGRDQRYSYGYSRDLKSNLEDMLRTAQGKEREVIEHAIRDLH